MKRIEEIKKETKKEITAVDFAEQIKHTISIPLVVNNGNIDIMALLSQLIGIFADIKGEAVDLKCQVEVLKCAISGSPMGMVRITEGDLQVMTIDEATKKSRAGILVALEEQALKAKKEQQSRIIQAKQNKSNIIMPPGQTRH